MTLAPNIIGFLSGFAVSLEFDEIHVNALAPACTLSIDTARTGSRPGPLGSQNDIATVTPAMRLKP